ncbi:helix-turn-helix domain-containing protein [Variovorax sp. J2P1-59]|uniref:helix-turn-helix domain-containing protein n=1 Tax=Variovorax flavidus TaxID=3053501 RepID=UPI002576CA65|nr:helix-turn-helix domain-containing protein [Variovorax sp. J2P1-59]MDM0078422.1 helix-turn-helix domain-containing protein [Variovorax sp. J2P1-59]
MHAPGLGRSSIARRHETTMTLRLDVFDDFHVHGASAPEWNQRYLQVSAGSMCSSLAEVTTDSMHVFRKWMSERVIQQGCLPSGKICFAVPLGEFAGTARMQGHEMRKDSIFVLRSGDEFTLQRPKGMELMAVTFELDDFRRLLDERPWAPGAQALLSRSVLRAPDDAMQRLRHDLLSLFDEASTVHPCDSDSIMDVPVSNVVFEALFELFDVAADVRQLVGSASASFVVSQCHRIVEAGGNAPPSVEELCLRIRTSRRTLQDSFRQVADSTPVHYLRCVRLNAVRRQLMSTRAADLSIAQAAEDRGFNHLGHFAERYKTLFGELPSQTMRAGAGTARALVLPSDERAGMP